ncbi:MAG TPA: hypothetical protein VGX76_11830, partial [Pirellulales bacterium]|nr:hypothetical protein [Pirellulales bacterium]
AAVCKDELDAAKSANRAPSRRLMMYYLTSAMIALAGSDGKGGLKAAANGSPAAEFIASLYAKLKVMHNDVDSDSDEELADTDVAAFTSKIGDLESSLTTNLPAKDEQLTAAARKEKKDPVAEPAKQ